MTKNPFFNAVFALFYIVGVVGLLSFGEHFAKETEDNMLIPIGMISLLVLSVASMAYLFFYQPIILLIDNQKKEAVTLFFKTIAFFGCFTLCLLGIALFIL